MHDDLEQVAGPARYNELIAAGAAAASWLAILIFIGPRLALQTVWILLLIALPLGAWTIMIRLRFSRYRLRVTLGPWSRGVDLRELQSIRWKDTGLADPISGTIYIRDRSGHKVSLSAGRFKRGDEWAPLLLHAAAASGATVDHKSREILEDLSRHSKN